MIFPILYAETHFRFRFLPSLYFEKEPEIIFDAPRYIEPGKALPILLIIKDANKYPINPEKVSIKLVKDNNVEYSFDFTIEKMITSGMYHKVLEVSSDIAPGDYQLYCEMFYKVNGKCLTCTNDNYRLKDKTLGLTILSKARPRFKGQVLGDCHYHTVYTDDFVEFGAPVAPTLDMANAMGFDFVLIADHSYDLDDSLTDYKVNDPLLPKWEQLKAEVSANKKDCLVAAGEELSCGNTKNQNIHLAIINEPEFFPGTGDGAEKPLRNKPETNLKNALKNQSSSNLFFAAHPFYKPHFLERMLLNRGSWSKDDLEDLDILQIYNGKKDRPFIDGLNYWISQLLQSKRKYIIAGNDSHGNFSCTRTIKYPMLKVSKSSEFFGAGFTVCIVQIKTIKAIIDSIKSGQCYISEGPALDLMVNNRGLGQTVSESSLLISLKLKSIPAFGSFAKIVLYKGNINTNRETEIPVKFNKPCFSIDEKIDIDGNFDGYLRIYASTDKDKELWSNPIFISK